jgi:hypothetical protein
MLLIWVCTVPSAMFSSYAICLFSKPRPISRITSRSRGVGVLCPRNRRSPLRTVIGEIAPDGRSYSLTTPKCTLFISEFPPISTNVLASLMQTMLLGFALPDRSRPGAGHTLKTNFGRVRRPLRYPNRRVTIFTFLSDRRHLQCWHVGNPMTDNADSEF